MTSYRDEIAITRVQLDPVRTDESVDQTIDAVAVEGPLEIRVNGRGYAVTMRTPGADIDLAVGFLLSEGVVREPQDVVGVTVPDEPGDVVDIEVQGPGALVAMDRQRNIYTSSSCGVCGLASIDAVTTTSQYDPSIDHLELPTQVIASLPEQLRQSQPTFERTGGVHAAGVYGADGESIAVAEDVGRHNAVDKVLGRLLPQGQLPLVGLVLQVSGRASFELVQKAVMAGIPVLSAVSAPSSLAIELAESTGVTLIGFSRGSAFNVYTHPARVSGLT